MSDAITKAVIALEQQHGVTSIMELPDRIVKKWRKDHERLFKEKYEPRANFLGDKDMVDEVYIKDSIDSTEQLSKIHIAPIVMGPVEDTIQTDKKIYYDVAKSVLKGNFNAKDIAKDLGRKNRSLEGCVTQVKKTVYYYILADGREFKANTLVNLENILLPNGINFKSMFFHRYMKNGGYVRFRNGNAYARVFKQYQVTPITLMDDNGKVIKEV